MYYYCIFFFAILCYPFKCVQHWCCRTVNRLSGQPDRTLKIQTDFLHIKTHSLDGQILCLHDETGLYLLWTCNSPVIHHTHSKFVFSVVWRQKTIGESRWWRKCLLSTTCIFEQKSVREEPKNNKIFKTMNITAIH